LTVSERNESKRTKRSQLAIGIIKFKSFPQVEGVMRKVICMIKVFIHPTVTTYHIARIVRLNCLCNISFVLWKARCLWALRCVYCPAQCL